MVVQGKVVMVVVVVVVGHMLAWGVASQDSTIMTFISAL